MIIATKLTEKEYQKLVLILAYRNRAIRFLAGLGLFLFAGMMFPLFGYLPFLPYKNTSNDTPYLPLLFAAYLVFGLPASVYFGAKKSYKTNLRIHEPITYELTDERLMITGQSFNGERDWSKTHMITELKGFFLIYETPKMMNIIPKSGMSPAECDELRNMIARIKRNNPAMK
jgi:YcxB-like protein